MGVFLSCISGFLAVFFLILLLANLLTMRRRQLHERLRDLSNVSSVPTKVKVGGAHAGINLQQIVAQIGRILAPKGLTQSQEAQLQKADIPLRGEEYLLLRLSVVIAPFFLTLIITRQLLLALALAAVGVLIPPFMVSQAQQRRMKKFNHQLTDSLAIMANSLRAGYSFMQAVELVSREMPDPIGKEFARTFREINLGTPMEDALANLGQRVGSPDLELVLTAVLIQRQIGGNLAEILDNISGTIRERIRIQGEIKTLTAQGRISGLIIGLIPPILVLIIALLNPAYIKPLFQTPLGWSMLAAGAISEFVGLVVIRKIISIEM